MKKAYAVGAALVLSFLSARTASAQHYAGFKSPGAGMRFTEGMPIVVFLDLFDSPYGSGFGTIVDGVGWPQGQVLVDGTKWKDEQTGSTTIAGPSSLDPNNNPEPVDFYRLVASGVPVGPHQLVARGLFQDKKSTDSAPIAITVDPWPADKDQVSLASGDVMMQDVTWNNVAVRGKNASLTVDGNLTIKNSLVTGLDKLTVTGAVTIEGSIFEDVGEIDVNVVGDVSVKNSEFRANNRLTFVTNNPEVPTLLSFVGSGNTSKALFQGNRVAAGIVTIKGGANWLIGGNTDDESNILMGPRCVFNVVDSHDVTMRGNYSRHNYRGGWSQGFNFYLYGSSDGILIEHNLIRGGSWPVQTVAGEFRYNVVFGYGHNWIRSASTGASIHHNIFAPEGSGQFGEGFWFYQEESGLRIYNNTFDGGGKVTGDFGGPFLRLTGSTQALSVRNNLFTYSRNMQNDSPGGPAIMSADEASYVSADYNAFYSPDNDAKDNYGITIAGKSEGKSGFAGNDVSGSGTVGAINGQLASHPFAGDRILPYETVVDEAAVWEGTQKLSAVLAAFRDRYTPKSGAPIIDKGDPQDNDAQDRRADIGAIDLDGHDQDKLGKFGPPPSELVPPTVTLTKPTAGAALTGTTTLEADAEDNVGGSGVVLVQFQVDGSTVGQTAKKPYSISFDTAVISNGDHAFGAKAWDAAGNFAVSPTVKVHVTGNAHGGEGGGGDTGGADGCGCELAGRTDCQVGWAVVVGLALAATRRRRRALV